MSQQVQPVRMALPPLPRVLNLTETDDESVDIDSGLGQAIMQGASYVEYLSIVDQNGDPFPLGPTNDPNWEFSSQLRSQFYDNDNGSAQLTFTCVVEDGPAGTVKISATPTQTEAINVQSGRWDIDMTNLSDTDFDVGFVQTLFVGTWKLFQDVTRV